MASYTQYIGNGSQKNFVAPEYIDQSHITVTVNGSPVTFSWLDASTVSLTSAPSVGTTVRIIRSTPSGALVDFSPGEVLTDSELDLGLNQSRFISEEARDGVEDRLAVNGLDVWDAKGKRIANAADPSSSQDLVTRAYGDANYGGGAAGVAASAAATATAAASAAAASAAAASTFDPANFYTKEASDARYASLTGPVSITGSFSTTGSITAGGNISTTGTLTSTGALTVGGGVGTDKSINISCATGAAWFVGNAPNGVVLHNLANADTTFTTNGITRARIAAGGNVSIGNDYANVGSARVLYVQNLSTTGNSSAQWVLQTGTTNAFINTYVRELGGTAECRTQLGAGITGGEQHDSLLVANAGLQIAGTTPIGSVCMLQNNSGGARAPGDPVAASALNNVYFTTAPAAVISGTASGTTWKLLGNVTLPNGAIGMWIRTA